MSVLDDSWLAKPKNDLRSLRFVGVGKLDRALVIEESTR